MADCSAAEQRCAVRVSGRGAAFVRVVVPLVAAVVVAVVVVAVRTYHYKSRAMRAYGSSALKEAVLSPASRSQTHNTRVFVQQV